VPPFDPELVAPDQLADLLWLAAAQAVERETVLVDLSVPLEVPELVQRTLRAAHTSGRVIVGVTNGPLPAANHPLAEALTLSFTSEREQDGLPAFVTAADPLAAAHEVAKVVWNQPMASASLAALLQQTAILPVWEGLVAESTTYSTLLAGPEFARWLRSAPARALAPDDDEPVLTQREGDLLHLTLNRPERRNAYGRGVRDALVSALEVARIDERVRVLLDGRGPAFSSGGDLAEFGTAPDPVTAHLVRIRHGAGLLIDELKGRTTVRIHGACIGAGIEIPAFAGTVIAAPDTSIGLPEVAMGLVPGAGGTVSITRRIGRWRTAWLALSGERLDPQRAQRWGLVDELS
jgi:hypothetical protein